MKQGFYNVIDIILLITFILGFFFPLVWVITFLVYLVAEKLDSNIESLDKHIKGNLSTLVQGDTVTFEKYDWESIEYITDVCKVIQHSDNYLEMVYHYEYAQLPIIIKAKRHWFRKSKCDLSLTVLVVSKTASKIFNQREIKQLSNEAIRELLQSNITLTDEEIAEAKKQMNYRF